MSWWDSYRAVYGAELRAAAREFSDHGWPVVAGSGLLLVTGTVLDVVEVREDHGRRICARLRGAGEVVPVAAAPGSWWFPVRAGGVLVERPGITVHTGGAAVLAPPSELADGWVHWRVAPASTGYRLPTIDTIAAAIAETITEVAAGALPPGDRDPGPGAQRPVAAGVRDAVLMRR